MSKPTAITRDLGEPKAKDAFDAVYQLQLHVDARFDRLEKMIEARLPAPAPAPAEVYRLATIPPPKDLAARSWWSVFKFW